MKEKIIDILYDALCLKRQTETQRISILRYANHTIIAGLRIASYLEITDYNKTM